MKRIKYMPIPSRDERKEMKESKTKTKKSERSDINVENCPYCGGEMRLKLCTDDRRLVGSAYYRSTYDSVQFKCGFCGSTSPKIYLTPDILDKDKIKDLMIKEYIEFDCDEDEEEENDDE